MNKLLAVMFLAVGVAPAEIQVSTMAWNNFSGIPAMYRLPPAYWREGVWVAVKTDEVEVVAFQITLTYIDAAGAKKAQTEYIPRFKPTNPDAWTNYVFLFPVDTMKTPAEVEVVGLAAKGTKKADLQ